MPIKKVGKDGYKFGNSGKLYKGKGAKDKAVAQMKAMYANGYKGKK